MPFWTFNGVIMIYRNNESVINEIRATAAREGTNLTGTASRLGMSQSNFSQIIHKKQLSFYDVSRIAAALGYRLHFELIKDPGADQATTSAPGQQPGL